MRIGHFHSGFPEPGGITNVVAGLSRAISNAGHQSFVYGCYPRHGDFRSVPGWTVKWFDETSTHPLTVSHLLLDRIQRNEDKLDLLLVHGMFSLPDFWVGRAARKAGLPYVVVPHGPYDPILMAKHRLRKELYCSLFEKRHLQQAAAIQVFSNRQRNLLHSMTIRGNIFAIPNALDVSTIPEAGNAAPLLAGDPKLLYLGRLDVYHKGIDLTLQAFAAGLRTRAIPSTAVLTLAGPPGFQSHTLAALITRLGIDKNTRFAGPINGADRWDLLRAADLTLLCSRYDGFGMVTIESLAVGTPVLVSDNNGTYDWIHGQPFGFHVRPEIASIEQGLSDAMQRSGEWPEMGRRAQEWARRYLTWDNVAQMAVEYYERIVASPKGAKGIPLPALSLYDAPRSS